MTAWLDTVKKTFKEGRVKNANYKLKDALRDAKKVYKKGEVAVVKVARKTKKAIKRRLKKYSNKKKSRKNRKSRRKYKKKGGEGHDGDDVETNVNTTESEE